MSSLPQHRWIAAIIAFGLLASATGSASAQEGQKKEQPNILVIWGDDIGQFNVSAYNDGMMGYRTPKLIVSLGKVLFYPP